MKTRLAAEIERNVATALAEDIGSGDLTAQLVHADAIGEACVISREDAVLCGTEWFESCFRTLDPAIVIDWKALDGEPIVPGQRLCEIRGNARAMLTAVRSALNFLQLLSGVASKARQYADAKRYASAGRGYARPCPVCVWQKHAVKCGGGDNHRLGLYDGILIKENHILAAGESLPL